MDSLVNCISDNEIGTAILLNDRMKDMLNEYLPMFLSNGIAIGFMAVGMSTLISYGVFKLMSFMNVG